MSDTLTNSLRDHLPSASTARDALSSAKDARDAVLDHLPSREDLDVSAVTDRLSRRKPGKRGLLAILLGLATVAGAAAVFRRKQATSPVSPSIYTPPLPKP